MSTAVNVNAEFPYAIDVWVRGTDGEPRRATAGEVTGITLRLSATAGGNAIHADVGNLAAVEDAGQAGRFSYTVSKTLHQTHIKPIGDGKSYYAVWSKSGAFDLESVRFIVADGKVQ
jgi:hypothetical protein